MTSGLQRRRPSRRAARAAGASREDRSSPEDGRHSRQDIEPEADRPKCTRSSALGACAPRHAPCSSSRREPGSAPGGDTPCGHRTLLARRPRGLASRRVARRERRRAIGTAGLRFVEPGVTLQRATEVSAEEALANLPFLPGDRVWTDAAGRAEFQFPDGTRRAPRPPQQARLLRPRGGPGRAHRAAALVGQRRSCACARRGAARFEIETPAGFVEALDAAMVRVDVDAGETRVSVYEGEAVLDDGRGRVRLAAGERTLRALGRRGRGAASASTAAEDDDFAQLGRGRASPRTAGPRARRVPARRARRLRRRVRAQRRLALRGRRSATSGSRASRSAGSPTRTAAGPGRPTAGPGCPTSAGAGRPPTTGAGATSASFGWYWVPGPHLGPGAG